MEGKSKKGFKYLIVWIIIGLILKYLVAAVLAFIWIIMGEPNGIDALIESFAPTIPLIVLLIAFCRPVFLQWDRRQFTYFLNFGQTKKSINWTDIKKISIDEKKKWLTIEVNDQRFAKIHPFIHHMKKNNAGNILKISLFKLSGNGKDNLKELVDSKDPNSKHYKLENLKDYVTLFEKMEKLDHQLKAEEDYLQDQTNENDEHWADSANVKKHLTKIKELTGKNGPDESILDLGYQIDPNILASTSSQRNQLNDLVERLKYDSRYTEITVMTLVRQKILDAIEQCHSSVKFLVEKVKEYNS